MHWRDIVQRYLADGIKDDMEGLLRAKERRQRRFLQEVGTSELVKRLAERDSKFLERTGKQRAALPSPEQYAVIEETEELVVVEVVRPGLSKIVGDNRFRLIREADSWRLDEIYWKCGFCDGGLCYFCHGENVCQVCKGRGKVQRRWRLRYPSCPICGGSGRCSQCEGTGACSHCMSSGMPGWQSLTEPLDDPDD